MSQNKNAYDEKSIKVLSGLEHVRSRPAMYIGGTDKSGYHHLLYEILDNSLDEALNGFASDIIIELLDDCKTISVKDNGRGIPVTKHPKLGKSTVEVIFTELFSGGKFDNDSYKASAGLHGVGASVVNVLCRELKVEVQRDSRIYKLSFERGKLSKKLSSSKQQNKLNHTGTKVTFTPDPLIFGDQEFDPKSIISTIEAKSYIYKNIHLRFIYGDTIYQFKSENGIVDLVNNMISTEKASEIHPQTISLTSKNIGDDVEIDCAFKWTDATNGITRSFANGVPNPFGGTHEAGFKDGISRSIRSYISTHDISLKGLKIVADDIREGLFSSVSVFLPNPQFQGQTKEKLLNVETKSLVSSFIYDEFNKFLNTNPDAAQSIVTRIIQAAKARQASRQAAKKINRKSRVKNSVVLPGKLADCQSQDLNETELFIVEGNSAAGSAKQGRDRKTQAILPLRGKILNAESASVKQVMKNNEIDNIIKAIGCGLGSGFNIKNLRYGKIILLMDADSDGHHIATLMLAFFYRYMPQLIKEGHVYVAQPPLYKLEWGKEKFWVMSDKEKDKVISKIKSKNSSANISIQRFKGLGEMMPDVLYDTTLNPKNRSLLQVEIPNHKSIEIEQLMSSLLGKDKSFRQELIFQSQINAKENG